jgi:hypothetical protein
MYEKTFVITDEYGEGGQVPANKFMIVTTSNMKSNDLKPFDQWGGHIEPHNGHDINNDICP